MVCEERIKKENKITKSSLEVTKKLFKNKFKLIFLKFLKMIKQN